MNLFKKMIFNFVSPVAMNVATASSFAIVVRSEALVGTVLSNLRRLIIDSFHTRNAVARPSLVKQKASIPLIKASTKIPENNPGCLKGKAVLCVGGQLRLYPAYRQIVEDAGGQFLSFHGAADAALADLEALLNNADMVICPIDCIRNDAFFLTKHYCNCFGKPCVMLDRARITTFYNGIRKLNNVLSGK